MARIVVVGGSLGGLRVTESLFSLGWEGEVVVVSEEKHPPYTRPPLSKKALASVPALETLAFKQRPEAERATWLYGTRVCSSDLAEQTVTLDDGTVLSYDGLVAATGVSARRLPRDVAPGGHVVRTFEDSVALQQELTAGATVVVIGAGFIGCEIAATAVRLGCDVHVVAVDEVPMMQPLGEQVGAAIQRRHEREGVTFHLGTQISSVQSTEGGHRIVLADGTALEADVYVQAIGSAPCVEWLEGNGLDLADGVLCDNWMRMGGRPGLVAVGDVARFPNPLFDDTARRVEHWQMPADTARRAAATLIADLAGTSAGDADFRPLPTFWSDQYDMRLQSFGNLAVADRVEVIEGDLDDEAVIGYFRGRTMVGAVTFGFPKKALLLRRQLMADLMAPGEDADGAA